MAWQLGVRTEALATASVEFPEHNGGGNMVLTSIDDGDFTGISQVDFADGAATVTARVKPIVAGTSIEVRLDSETGPVVATLEPGDSVGEWTEIEATVEGADGVHDLFFVFHGPGRAPARGRQLVIYRRPHSPEPTATPTPTRPRPRPRPDPDSDARADQEPNGQADADPTVKPTQTPRPSLRRHMRRVTCTRPRASIKSTVVSGTPTASRTRRRCGVGPTSGQPRSSIREAGMCTRRAGT
nr:carbohydrate-binding protein [Tessaracoccus coleopterorum]